MKHRLLTFVLAGALLVPALPLTMAATPPAAELISAGRVDELMGLLRDRLQRQPGDAEAHFLMLRAYFQLQKWDDAIGEGQKAVELAPDNFLYHLWLGRAYGEKADHAGWGVTALMLAKKTRAEFERAVVLNGQSIEARTDLAEFYAEAPGFLGGSPIKAQAQADTVKALGNAASAHFIRARVAENKKDYPLAELELLTGIGLDNDNSDLLMNLASFYRRRNRLDEMQATVDKAVKTASRAPRSHVLYDAAEVLWRSGRNYPGAAQMLRTYIAAPQHDEQAPVFRAHYLLGTLLEKLGDKRAAADEYRAALALARDFDPAASALKRIHGANP